MAIIESGLEAVEMRNRMESKGALEAKGSLYVGTGDKTTVTKSDNSTVTIPVTTAFNPPDTTDANGGVMIWDTSVNSDTGWAVAKIKTKNLENGRVEQANKADRADTILFKDEYKSFAGAFVQECLSKIYPIGSIYMSANNVSPQTFLGGTWVAWGSGKVPVGVDTSDTSFNTVEKTGGEKTHTLTESEMPKHAHTGTNVALSKYNASGLGGITQVNKLTLTADYTSVDGGEVTAYETAAKQEPLVTLTDMYGIPKGGDGAHNNLQPYITCYMFKRVS